MLIDLRNTPYYLSKNFSIKEDVFGGRRDDLTEEEKERVANLNLASTAMGVTGSMGLATYLVGREMQKEHDRRKNAKDPRNRMKTDGTFNKKVGLTALGTSAALALASQLLKYRLYKKKDKEKEEEKTFANSANPAAPTPVKPKNVAQVTQGQMAQQRAAQAQQKMAQANQLETGRNNRAGQVQQRFAAQSQQRNVLEAGRNNRLNQKISAQQQSNVLRAKEIAQKNSGIATNPGLYKPNVGMPPVVSMD